MRIFRQIWIVLEKSSLKYNPETHIYIPWLSLHSPLCWQMFLMKHLIDLSFLHKVPNWELSGS